MNSIDIVCKILGLKKLMTFDKVVSTNKIIISIDSNNNTSTNITNISSTSTILKYCSYPVNILYSVIILLLLLFDPIINIYFTIKTLDYKYLLGGFMSYTFIFQYFVGLMYFKKNKKINYSTYILVLWVISLFGIIVISILPNILLVYDIKVFMYSELQTVTNITYHNVLILCAFAGINKFIGYCIFLLNILLFSIIFISHSIKLSKYVKKTKVVLMNYESNVMTIDSIIDEYLVLKENYKYDVIRLNDIFAVVTISTVILGYNILSNGEKFITTKYLSVMHIIDIVLLIIIEIIHLIIISRVNTKINELREIVFSKHFIECLLTKNNTENIYTDEQYKEISETQQIMLKVKQIKDVSIKNLVYSSEALRKLDWSTLIMIITEKWVSFNILGFVVESSTRIKQIIGIGGCSIMLITLLMNR